MRRKKIKMKKIPSLKSKSTRTEKSIGHSRKISGSQSAVSRVQLI
jgi:hypothetical protein